MVRLPVSLIGHLIIDNYLMSAHAILCVCMCVQLAMVAFSLAALTVETFYCLHV